MKVHKTKRYVRYRVRSPKRFVRSSFRAHDIGRKGHSKRIAGKLKSTGRWATQAVLVTKADYKKGRRVRMVAGRPSIVLVRASHRARSHYRRSK